MADPLTWEKINNQFAPEITAYWPDQVALARSLADRVPHLDEAQCRLLVDYTHARLPLLLTWDTYLPDLGKIETNRAAVIVDYLIAPRPGQAAQAGRLRVRYPGFGHEVRLSQVTTVESIPTETTFRSPAEQGAR